MKEIDNIILDLDGTVYVDNKIINKSSNILFLSAGHSSILDMINFKKGFVYEIIDSFHSLYSKKNISKIKSKFISFSYFKGSPIKRFS